MKAAVGGVMRRVRRAPASEPPAWAFAQALGEMVISLGEPFRVPVKMKVGRMGMVVVVVVQVAGFSRRLGTPRPLRSLAESAAAFAS